MLIASPKITRIAKRGRYWRDIHTAGCNRQIHTFIVKNYGLFIVYTTIMPTTFQRRQ